MKKILSTVLFISAVMLLLPLSVLKDEGSISAAAVVENIEISTQKAENAAVKSFKVKDTESGKTTEISAKDYIFGVVAAEMPALYSEEALKAQAVAAYTFACSRRTANKENGYDITTDHTTDQSYITEKAANEKWGDKADEYTEKIKNAVSEAEGYMITYDGKPITAVYHAISAGKTEDAKNIWGKEIEYLKPVVSEGDRLCKDYISEVTFKTEELTEKLKKEIPLSGDEKDYFGECSKTDSGTVAKIKVCSSSVTGAKLRSLLDLRSSAFDINYADGAFTFTVYGYGHGVGMSQNGANYMAKQGSSFKEILTHYYTDCKVEKIY